MTSRYTVDGIALVPDEEARHKGACNAVLNALSQSEDAREIPDTADSQEASRESLVSESFDVADEAVREYRRRIQSRNAPVLPPSLTQPYTMISDEAIIARWTEGSFELSVGRNLAIGKLKALRYPLTRKEISEAADVHDHLLLDLIAAKVLVPHDDEGEPNATKGGEETNPDE